jgi:SAM-dependent methyltransferase
MKNIPNFIQSLPADIVLEDAPCPNGCVYDDIFLLKGYDRLHNLPGVFNIVKCKTCGLQRTNPRPNSDSIGFYYPSNYGPYLIKDSFSKKSNIIISIIKGFFGFESRTLPSVKGNVLLDIGCSSGDFLLEKKGEGWDVSGLEFSEEAGKLAIKRGLNVIISSLENAPSPKIKFDIITAWMVFEHLHQPLLVFNKIIDWIQPNGYLVFSIPDTGSLNRQIFKSRSYDLHLPGHLYHYSPNTIEKLLNDSGWEIVKIKWQKNPNSLINSIGYYIDDLNSGFFKSILYALNYVLKLAPIRLVLGFILGSLKLSGRIEVWAKPKPVN